MFTCRNEYFQWNATENENIFCQLKTLETIGMYYHSNQISFEKCSKNKMVKIIKLCDFHCFKEKWAFICINGSELRLFFEQMNNIKYDPKSRVSVQTHGIWSALMSIWFGHSMQLFVHMHTNRLLICCFENTRDNGRQCTRFNSRTIERNTRSQHRLDFSMTKIIYIALK